MPGTEFCLRVDRYDLEATLTSGQAFRWHQRGDAWIGVVGRRWVSLRPADECLHARTAEVQSDWEWLVDYLQARVNLAAILETFPDDAPMRTATRACRGLRLLRQDPWECLASFILSSTKQIAQIRQIIALLCERFGEPLAVPPGEAPAFAFPTARRLAAAEENELRACRMGFRAPHLLAAARQIAQGKFDLARPRTLPLTEAREALKALPGVGDKIADCVLLFAYGFEAAFPVDVWIARALRQRYFPRRPVTPRRLRQFAVRHFGPHAGYAQQYLFHSVRLARPKKSSA